MIFLVRKQLTNCSQDFLAQRWKKFIQPGVLKYQQTWHRHWKRPPRHLCVRLNACKYWKDKSCFLREHLANCYSHQQWPTQASTRPRIRAGQGECRLMNIQIISAEGAFYDGRRKVVRFNLPRWFLSRLLQNGSHSHPSLTFNLGPFVMQIFSKAMRCLDTADRRLWRTRHVITSCVRLWGPEV